MEFTKILNIAFYTYPYECMYDTFYRTNYVPDKCGNVLVS